MKSIISQRERLFVDIKWTTFKTDVNFPRSGRPSKFTPWSELAILAKKQQQKSYISHFIVSKFYINIHGRTIRKRHKYACLKWLPLLSKSKMASLLRFAKLNLNKRQGLENNVLVP